MRHLVAVALVVAVVVAAAPSAVGHIPAKTPRSCGQVNFTPNSDDLAANILATGLTCGIARDFVRDSRGTPGARFRGFRCTSTAVPSAGLAFTRYRCSGAGDVIRWRRY